MSALEAEKNKDDIFATTSSQPDEQAREEDEKETSTGERELPTWAQEPIATLVLKVYKDGSLMGQIKLGEKKRYLFGREPNMVDVLLLHPTISRKQAVIVHGTPPGTNERYCRSATIQDLGSGSTYYKKSRFKDEKYRLKPGTGVVLRTGMALVFAQSSRVYEVCGIDATGSMTGTEASTNKSDLMTDKLSRASVQRGPTKLNEDGKLRAEMLKRKLGDEEFAFANQAGRNADYEARKKMRVTATSKTALLLEAKNKLNETRPGTQPNIQSLRVPTASTSSSSSSGR